MNLLDQERLTYQTIWAIEAYGDGSPGEMYLPLFLDMAQPSVSLMRGGRGSVLDAGCGAGKGALALTGAGFDVTLCDLSADWLLPEVRHLPFHAAALWEPLTRAVGFRDWVFCTDVLEHIPPTFTMLVVSRLLEVARKGVFLTIALLPDHFGAWAGRPLHQTVQTFPQWRDQLATLARVKEARDLLDCGVFLLEPPSC